MNMSPKRITMLIAVGLFISSGSSAFAATFTSYPGRILKGAEGAHDEYTEYGTPSSMENTGTNKNEVIVVAPLPRRRATITSYVNAYVFYHEPSDSDSHIACQLGVPDFDPAVGSGDPPFFFSSKVKGRAGTGRLDLKISMKNHYFEEVSGYFLRCWIPKDKPGGTVPQILQIDVWEQ